VRHRSVEAGPGWPGVVIILGFAFLSVVMTFMGMTTLRDQHSGVPAWITVEKCSSGSFATCWGVWPASRHQTTQTSGNPITVSSAASRIEIQGTGQRDVGRQIGVHVHDNRYAVADASSYPIYEVGMGLALAIAAVTALVLRRQRTVDQACQEDQPSTAILTTGPVNEIRSY
jgi:hypothetical protein